MCGPPSRGPHPRISTEVSPPMGRGSPRGWLSNAAGVERKAGPLVAVSHLTTMGDRPAPPARAHADDPFGFA